MLCICPNIVLCANCNFERVGNLGFCVRFYMNEFQKYSQEAVDKKIKKFLSEFLVQQQYSDKMAKKKAKSKSAKQNKTVKINPTNITTKENEIALVLNSVNQPVLLKLCRLCGAKDGPFLNIFDPDKVTAKKIQDLMPFTILENDDLPHKICFRCSAKVEELHEFLEKCVRTQESLQASIGNKSVPKTKITTQWKEKLNKSNISNDDICNALIKKAMEGIKDIPINSLSCNETKLSSNQVSIIKIKGPVDSPNVANKEVPSDTKVHQSYETDTVLKKVKLSLEKCDSKPAFNKCLRSKNSDIETEKIIPICKIDVDETNKNIQNVDSDIKSKMSITKPENLDSKIKVNESSDDNVSQQDNVNKATPFNIMDHITTIKVNGVGILFQCKLCNRNFLKKEVVEVHACARNGIVKQNLPKPLPQPEPPKTLNSVKYIDSKRTSEANKSIKLPTDVKKEPLPKSNKSDDVIITSECKTKPKIGPASKIKRDNIKQQLDRNKGVLDTPKPNSDGSTSSSNNIVMPVVNFPAMPALNSRYKLISGPNNTFSLVEDSSFTKDENVGEPQLNKTGITVKPAKDDLKKNVQNVSIPVVINLDDDNDKPSSSKQQPYPVGLFSTRPHNSSTQVNPEAPKFTTPGMKKQSYTVVQTDNPSKLVISTKQTPVEDIPKKRSKKVKLDATAPSNGAVKEPFSVTLEDVAHTKDPGFFTFINVDPLLQPSYVLPTDSIIQESQISTSTPAITNNPQIREKDKYQCTICDLTFSREKKMLTHIQSHYSKVDDDDDMEDEINENKKRKRKP